MKNFNLKINKTGIRIVLLFSLAALFFLLYKSFKSEQLQKQKGIEERLAYRTISPIESNTKRESITFILGEDRELDNPYYAEAINFYQHNNESRTEYLVTECRSLLEVHNYLSSNPPQNNNPWGLINLISHGNQWIGLSVKVTPESKRASTENILTYIDSGFFKALPENIIDNNSEIFIHGCGVGNNKYLVNAVAKAFSGDNYKPVVRASKLFEYYTSVKNNQAIVESQRYLAQTWYIKYKRGYKPENNCIANCLRKQYPETNIEWRDALTREQPRYAGDIYHYTFDIPVKWVIKYSDKDSMPDLTTKANQHDWIANQRKITKLLEQIEIPIEDFNWWFRTVYVNNEDGTRSPAVWIKGYCTILCVIKPLLDENKGEKVLSTPYTPELEDNNYYYSYNQTVH